MKLLKKLLPVAAIASTAAVVAPIVTSCGVANLSFSSKIKEDGTLETEYQHKVEQHAAVTPGISTEDGEKLYFEEVVKNPMILADDWMSTYYTYITGKFPTPKTLNASTKYSGSGNISISLSKVDETEKRISGKIALKTNVIQTDEEAEVTEKITRNINMSMNFKNLPMIVGFNSGYYNYWYCQLADQKKLSEDANWEISFNFKEVQTLEGVGSTTSEMSGKCTKDKGFNYIAVVSSFLQIGLFYMDEVEHA